MAYGPDLPTMFRQAAGHVDRILRGAMVGDLPVERPSKVALIINQALGLPIPQSLLARADQIIRSPCGWSARRLVGQCVRRGTRRRAF